MNKTEFEEHFKSLKDKDLSETDSIILDGILEVLSNLNEKVNYLSQAKLPEINMCIRDAFAMTAMRRINEMSEAQKAIEIWLEYLVKSHEAGMGCWYHEKEILERLYEIRMKISSEPRNI